MQEAEATCDFDWEQVASPVVEVDDERSLPDLPSSPLRDDDSPDSHGGGGVRLSGWLGNHSGPHSQADSGVVTHHTSNAGTPELDATGQPHKRGSSVGHRGFLAARNASSDKLTKTPPLTLEVIEDSGVSWTAPTSLTTPTDPPTQSIYNHSYFPMDGDYLSDPESTRPGGSNHRKSSSHGSFDSSGRSLQTATESTRWSSASTSSIPDLMHSHRKSVRKSLASSVSKPLESVPHSPDGRDAALDYLAADPPSTQDHATSDGMLMRRPGTGDRTLLFQSGRVVQRGRQSTTPSRMAIHSLPPDDQEGGWI
jgi:hypothetical protein